AFLNDDPSLPPPTQGNYLPEVRKELKIYEAKSDKSSIDEPLEIDLKDLPPYLEYTFLEGDDKLPVIITKDLNVEEKTALITVLKSHKRAIAWKLSDIKGIDLEFCTQKILMEEDFEPAVQHQRRVNPKIHDVIKQESCSSNMLGDQNVTLKDISGTIPGTIHHKVIGKGGYGKDIIVGAAIILKNVSVFIPKPSEHYLNITMRHVVKVSHKDTVLGSGTG
nr:reverse transcriptase domain-containing protein [Tanacetum cinerariifolium]